MAQQFGDEITFVVHGKVYRCRLVDMNIEIEQHMGDITSFGDTMPQFMPTLMGGEMTCRYVVLGVQTLDKAQAEVAAAAQKTLADMVPVVSEQKRSVRL